MSLITLAQYQDHDKNQKAILYDTDTDDAFELNFTYPALKKMNAAQILEQMYSDINFETEFNINSDCKQELINFITEIISNWENEHEEDTYNRQILEFLDVDPWLEM